MPEKQITKHQEEELDKWLRDNKAVPEKCFFRQNGVFVDIYELEGGSLTFNQDLEDRTRLNKIFCNDKIAQALTDSGIVDFSEEWPKT